MMNLTKNIFLSIVTLLISQPLFSQSWKEMMHDPSVNVYDVVKDAEAYFENVDIYAKGSGWKKYQRWLNENEHKFFPSGDRSLADPYFTSNAFAGFQQNNPLAKPLYNGGWKELGPYYIEQVTGHYSVGLGRLETFYVDPNDPQRIYVGSRSGGFWRSLDGGATWTGSTTDTLIASGVNTMTVSPTNPDSVLINVRNALNGASHGIYRSTDAGDSWEITAFNPVNLGWGGLGTNAQVYVMSYHPTIPGLVFIGTSEGIYRSDDDMITWTNPIGTLDFTAIDFHPTDPNIIYAASRNNDFVVYYSTDGGNSWISSLPLIGNTADLKLSTTPACPTCVFARSSDGIWKSNDEGQIYTQISNPGISNYGGFAVSDVDTNVILIGDIDTHMSLDHGQTFNKVTFWSQGNANYNTTGAYVHADIRGARCINGVFWVNTDGMLGSSTDNGTTWQLYEGQSIRENYNLGVSQSNHYRTITGSQDNGTSIRTENSWVEFYGADGMEGIIHPLNDDYMMGSVQNGIRRRTTDGGQTQTGATPQGQTGYWIAPLLYDPNDQMVVYHMGDTIYRSEEFGLNWSIVGTPNFGGVIQYATIAENNSDIIVATRQGNIEISHDGGSTFASIKNNLPTYTITDVVFDPRDDSTLVVTYGRYQNDGQKVFITHDQGATWQNITYNLNDMPVRCAVIDHTHASTIYLGTEIGVYKKAMADSVWSLYSDGLPNMTVRELEVMWGSNTLRATTWGRGLWEYSLDDRITYPAILTTSITDQPTLNYPAVGQDQYVTSVIVYDSTITSAYIEWSENTPKFGNVIPMTNTMDSTWVTNSPIPNQPIGTKIFFKVFAVGVNGDTTETYKFMYRVHDFEYCASSGNMGWQTSVTLVDFNGIYNQTGKTQPYTNYTASDSSIVDLGNSYDLNVWLNTDGNFVIYSKAWIDWNRDYDFDDAGEEYDMGTAQNTANGPTTFSPVTVTVPMNAALGKTRMRVAARYNTSPDPCAGPYDGEVEDYAIIVQNPVGITEVSSGTIRAYPNPVTNILTLEFSEPKDRMEITILNAAGQALGIPTIHSATPTLQLDMTNYPEGLYFVKIVGGSDVSMIKITKM